MIPRVAGRGSSFKGAGLYYLHDKKAQTNERVDWTLTHNIPTQDPNKALKWMSYTSMNAEKIKAEYGGSRAGAKSNGKPVYAYSLSWHPEDKPDREEMEKAAFSSLEKLGLKDHEVLIVAHKDEPQPHVHVICNLVHPQTGKTKSMSLDFNHFSKWAQEHDKEHGRTHCPERLKNNAERYKDKAKGQFVKHSGDKEHRAALFQSLHVKHKSGAEFQKAMEENGYTLAMGRGRRNRILVIDKQGEIYALTRQLKKEDGKKFRAKDLKERLKDVDLKNLPDGQAISDERKFEAENFDRDKYATEQNNKMLDAAMEHAKTQAKTEKKAEQEKRKDVGKTKNKTKEKKEQNPLHDDSHLKEIDALSKFYAFETKKRVELENHLTEFYGRDKMAKTLASLNKKIQKHENTWGKLTGKYKKLQEEKEALEKTLANTDMRIAEYRGKLEKELEKERLKIFPNKRKADLADDNVIDFEEAKERLSKSKTPKKKSQTDDFNEKAQKIDKIKKHLKKQLDKDGKKKSPSRNKRKGLDLDL